MDESWSPVHANLAHNDPDPCTWTVPPFLMQLGLGDLWLWPSGGRALGSCRDAARGRHMMQCWKDGCRLAKVIRRQWWALGTNKEPLTRLHLAGRRRQFAWHGSQLPSPLPILLDYDMEAQPTFFSYLYVIKLISRII